MIELKETTVSAILEKIASFRILRPVYNNYFGLSAEDKIGYFISGNTLLISKDYNLFERLYVVSTDRSELKDILSNLSQKKVYAVNVPSKDDISIWSNLFSEISWIKMDSYSRYNNYDFEKRGDFDGSLAEERDINRMCELMKNHFSPISDRLPSKMELEELVRNKCVVVSRFEDGTVSGFLSFEIQGKRVYTSVWVDESKKGLYLYMNTLNYIKELGYNMIYTWIRDTNLVSVKTQMLLGFKPDGLKDYTFVNKCL